LLEKRIFDAAVKNATQDHNISQAIFCEALIIETLIRGTAREAAIFSVVVFSVELAIGASGGADGVGADLWLGHCQIFFVLAS
jgi:hypothetical protein